MKKIYFAPEMEEILIRTNTLLLELSGGGINDDLSAQTDDTPSDDPNEDFGW